MTINKIKAIEKTLIEKTTLNNVVPLSGSNVKGGNTRQVEKTVLPDECGDSLWYDLLEEKNLRLQTIGIPVNLTE